MFKKSLVLFCLLLFAFSCHATVYLVEPLDQRLSQNQEVFFGKIAAGETLKVVAKKKSDFGVEWNSLSVNVQLLPNGWDAEMVETDKTIIANVKVPANALISTQRIGFTASNSIEPMFSETFYGMVSVNENLLSASIENLNQGVVLGEKAEFSLVLNNDSIADHSVIVRTDLPDYWFSAQTVGLKPLEAKTVEMPVIPYSYGEKSFSFTVSSMENDSQFRFPAKMNVKPTLVGMFQAPLVGFPFFSPGLLPCYLINGFLSLF